MYPFQTILCDPPPRPCIYSGGSKLPVQRRGSGGRGGERGGGDRSNYHPPSVFRPKFPTAEYFRTMVPLAMIPPGWIMLEPPKEFYRSRGKRSKEQGSRDEGFKEPETIEE